MTDVLETDFLTYRRFNYCGTVSTVTYGYKIFQNGQLIEFGEDYPTRTVAELFGRVRRLTHHYNTK